MRIPAVTVTIAATLAAILGSAAGCKRGQRPAAPPPKPGEAVKVHDLDDDWAQSEPVAVGDTAGNLLVAWMDWTPPRPHVRMALSTNGGKSFAASRPVHRPDPDHADGQADPSLVRTGDGRIVLSWLACALDSAHPAGKVCDVLGRESADAGRTWTDPFAIARGGAAKRDRPWLATDGTQVFATWTEELADDVRWVVAARTGPGRFERRGALPGRSGIVPPAASSRGLEALVMDRRNGDPARIVMERVRSRDGRTFETDGTVAFDRAAVLLDYSLGAFAVARDGAAWMAIPRGRGLRNDFTLGFRAAGEETFRTVGGLRTDTVGRVGLPWIEALPDGRFLAVWLEDVGEPPGGWRVMARWLTAQGGRGAPAALTAPFEILPASLDRNVGDFLAATGAGGNAWAVWSDTREGDADVYAAPVRPADGS